MVVCCMCKKIKKVCKVHVVSTRMDMHSLLFACMNAYQCTASVCVCVCVCVCETTYTNTLVNAGPEI